MSPTGRPAAGHPASPLVGPIRRRRGVSLLEVQVAGAVFMIVISGLAPPMVLNTRQAGRLREQIPDSTPLYLAPNSRWQAKLGAAAQVDQSPITPVVPQTIVDDGAQDWSARGSFWYQYDWPDAYGEDFRLFWADGYARSTWTLEVEPGVYPVQVTYPSFTFLNTTARYQVRDGGVLLDVVTVNQQAPPSDAAAEGVQWLTLGVYPIESGKLQLRLTGNTNEWTAVDAIRATQLRESVELLSVVKDRDADSVVVTAEVK